MNGQGKQAPPGNGPVAILGAGSLGRLWAGCFPPGSVVFLTRRGTVPAPDSDVLHYQLQRPDGARIPVSVPWVAASTVKPALLLVTTKAGDTLAATEDQLTDLPPDTPIVLFQNGMGSQQAVARRWPERLVFAAATTEGANRPEAALTIHAGRGQTRVGALTDSAEPLLAPVVQALAASGLTVHPETDIRQRLWDKLVINCGINAFTAILNCSNGDILKDRFYLRHIDDLCTEIAAVLVAEGMQPQAPASVRQRIEAVAESTAGNTSSMLGDVQRGRATEIDFINGYVVSRARAQGIEVPVNQMLTERVKRLSAGAWPG